MLAAWLAFVVVASVLPCLLFAIVYEPDGHGAWVVSGGSVHRWSITRAEGAQMGEPETTLRWEPSIANGAFFTWKSYNAVPGAPRQSVLIIGGPTWPFFLAPTIVALGILHARRTLLNRRLNQQRAAGRTLCPACQYDATGLSTCPECGAAITANTEPPP